jgi:hypothetical protein
MGAAQSTECDNTLSRLSNNAFKIRMNEYCLVILQICDDYLSRGQDAMMHHALLAYRQKSPLLATDESMTDFKVQLSEFINGVNELRGIVGRMAMTVNYTGPASFLEKLSANLICRNILSQMECKTMMVGGHMTNYKDVIGQECWRNDKLNRFFSNLATHLKKTFASFHVVSKSQIVLEGLLVALKTEILNDPNFEKEVLSQEDLIIQQILQETLKTLPAACNKQVPSA